MADAGRKGRKCSQGHTMDPSWGTCPYCESEQRSKEKTIGMGAGDSSDRWDTRVQSPAPDSPQRNRETREMAPPQRQAEPIARADGPRIVGVLVTYTWQPEGQLFAVRQGKNFIGRGQISSEPDHPDCDVQIPHDHEMSQEHALILCQAGNYEIRDQISTNGTFLNGTRLKANDMPELPDRAQIRTGGTIWTFLQIQPAAASRESRPSAHESEPKPSDKRGESIGQKIL